MSTAERQIKIAIGSEAMAYQTKQALKQHLCQLGYQVVDVGTTELNQPVSHIDAAENVANLLQRGACEYGILLCRTGAGISIAANKHKGIRCVLCESRWTAYSSRKINDANVLAMGSDVVTTRTACDMAEIFLKTPFADAENDERKALLSGYLHQLEQHEAKQFHTE